jgi:hypothetical protein
VKADVGTDVTEEYERGTEIVLEIVERYGISGRGCSRIARRAVEATGLRLSG